MPGEHLEHERTEWDDRRSVRHKIRCKRCGSTAKVTGSPVERIDELADLILSRHGQTCP